jgi:uncharacterized HAD superfamily protein
VWSGESCLQSESNPFVAPEERTELLWCAVDFDGTLAVSTWSPKDPNASPGEPIWENIDKLNDLVAKGYKVVIHTSRSWAAYETVEAWLNHYNVPFKAIVCGKLLAKVYIDDRALNADEASWDLTERVMA